MSAAVVTAEPIDWGRINPHPARATTAPLDPGSVIEWCYWCQLAPSSGRDHLIPKSRGGSNEPENLVPACVVCNSTKGTRTPSEYGAYLLAKARVMSTTCPRCGAGPGEPCFRVTPWGPQRTYDLHPARKEAAHAAHP